MQASLNTSKWYDRLWAALIFFTRLPFWRLHQPPREAYQSVVEFWPLAGWLTSGVMAGVLYGSSLLFSYEIAILLAITSRLLLTGALHEDGLADFFDGFGGGGQDRQRILDIMKDSHIGTYGVLSLIVYFALLFFTLHSLPPLIAAFSILAIDPYAKMVSAQVIHLIPYARTEADAKNRLVYVRTPWMERLLSLVLALVPLAVCLLVAPDAMPKPEQWLLALLLPVGGCIMLFMWMRRRLQGYTGDCCGATFLITETLIYLSLCLIV